MDSPLLQLLREDPMAFVLLAVALVFAIALHEFAHALTADRLGDRMPRAMGRVTLNPLRHLDPLGTLAILLVGFGWGKPVEFRPDALVSKRFGGALVALAGPSMNLLLAVGSAFGLVVMVRSGDISGYSETLFTFLQGFFGINVLLAVFNLIPLPPLDGSRLLTIFLPASKRNVIYFLDQYGFLILLALVFLGGLRFMEPVMRAVSEWIIGIVS